MKSLVLWSRCPFDMTMGTPCESGGDNSEVELEAFACVGVEGSSGDAPILSFSEAGTYR